MPRRPARIKRDVPLYLISHTIQQGVNEHGEELDRVVVDRTRWHHYNISIRTRPVKRELGIGRRRRLESLSFLIP
jgi:hypothetical protein